MSKKEHNLKEYKKSNKKLIQIYSDPKAIAKIGQFHKVDHSKSESIAEASNSTYENAKSFIEVTENDLKRAPLIQLDEKYNSLKLDYNETKENIIQTERSKEEYERRKKICIFFYLIFYILLNYVLFYSHPL